MISDPGERIKPLVVKKKKKKKHHRRHFPPSLKGSGGQTGKLFKQGEWFWSLNKDGSSMKAGHLLQGQRFIIFEFIIKYWRLLYTFHSSVRIIDDPILATLWRQGYCIELAERFISTSLSKRLINCDGKMALQRVPSATSTATLMHVYTWPDRPAEKIRT